MPYTTQGYMTPADMADLADLYDWNAGEQEAAAAGDLTTEDTLVLEDGVDHAIHAVDIIGQTVEVRTDAGTFYYGVDEEVTVTL